MDQPLHNTTADDSYLLKWMIPPEFAMSACHINPTMISYGYLYTQSWPEILQHPASLLIFRLFLTFFFQANLYFILKPLHLPPVTIQVLAGIIIGSIYRENALLRRMTSSVEATDAMNGLNNLGYILFFFVVAVKADLSTMKKSGRNTWVIGILSTIVPIATLWGISKLPKMLTFSFFPSYLIEDYMLLQSVSQFAVTIPLLVDLEILNSEVGRFCSSASLISNAIGILIQYGMQRRALFLRFSKGLSVKIFVMTVIIFFGTVVAGKMMMRAIVKRTPEGKPVARAHIHIILGTLAVLAIVSDISGMEYTLGPFFLGLMVPAGPPLGSTLARKLDTSVLGFFMPILMTYAGSNVNLKIILPLPNPLTRNPGFLGFTLSWVPFLSIFFVICLLKFAIIVLPARLYKMPYRDAFVVFLILSAKGTVEIGFYIDRISKGRYWDLPYGHGIIIFLAIATVIPMVVRKIYDPSRRYRSYQKRDIQHATKDRTELSILTCIHRQDDALAAIDLLELSNLTAATPVTIHALNLVELVGRAIPVFINHQNHDIKDPSSTYGTHLKHITDFLNYYESQHQEDALKVNMYTSVSSNLFMYDDICSLAFNKGTSLILLPFHKKWNAKGKVVLDDAALRATNIQVLQKAPCSVGVLIDRRRSLNPYSVVSPTSNLNRIAVVFIGGDDDREAVSLGKQMAESPLVQLTIVRVMGEDDEEDKWEEIINKELFKGIKYESGPNLNVLIQEEVVRQGCDTVSIIQSMESKFELIIVGLNHKKTKVISGMDDWEECKELGVMGDFLGSSDIESAVSVLVVQQHKLKK